MELSAVTPILPLEERKNNFLYNTMKTSNTWSGGQVLTAQCLHHVHDDMVCCGHILSAFVTSIHAYNLHPVNLMATHCIVIGAEFSPMAPIIHNTCMA